MARSWLLLIAATLAMLALSQAATWQKVKLGDNLILAGVRYPPRARFTIAQYGWLPNLFNWMPALGITDPADSTAWLGPSYLRVGPLLRKFDNTTVELLQRGVEINNYNPFSLDSVTTNTSYYHTSSLRGSNVVVYQNVSEYEGNGVSWRYWMLVMNGYNPINDTLNEIVFSLSLEFIPGTGGLRMRYFPVVLTTGFAREGASSVLTPPIGQALARMIIYGGHNRVSDTNTLVYRDLPWDKNAPVLATNQPVTNPGPRSYHAAVSYTVGSVSYMLLWGGKNANTYLGDGPWILNTIAATWEQVTPTGATPAARAGHTLTMLGTDSIYLFGGTNGTYTFNDFWVYSIANQTWTLLLNGGNEPEPQARAYHAAVALDSVTIAFHGGYDSAGVALNDWVSVNVNDTCPFFCPHPSDLFQSDGACMTAAQCTFIRECSWDREHIFQCGLGCVSNPSQCNVAQNCSTETVWTDGSAQPHFRCWHGLCVSDPNSCKVWPRCAPGLKRCDGDCVPHDTNCLDSVSCPPGLKVCVDGSCSESCPPYDGCLPDGKAVQCWDGTCAESLDKCHQNCTAPQVNCWDGCRDDSTCPQPYYTDSIHLMAFADPSQYAYYLFKKEGRLDPTDIRAVITLEKTAVYPNLTALIRSAYTSDFAQVGPEPYWSAEFDPDYMLSSIMYATFKGVTDSYTSDPNTAFNLIFRHPVPSSDVMYWARTQDEALGYIQQAACVAFAVPWFWDPMDLMEHSGLADVPYIRDYRLNMTGQLNTTMTPPPRFRWKCQRDSANFWPRIIKDFPFANDTHLPSADKWLGIRLTGDVENQIAALIRSPQPPRAPEIPPTVLELPPVDPNISYGVVAVAAFLLAVLIVVVIIKTLTQRN